MFCSVEKRRLAAGRVHEWSRQAKQTVRSLCRNNGNAVLQMETTATNTNFVLVSTTQKFRSSKKVIAQIKVIFRHTELFNLTVYMKYNESILPDRTTFINCCELCYQYKMTVHDNTPLE